MGGFEAGRAMIQDKKVTGYLMLVLLTKIIPPAMVSKSPLCTRLCTGSFQTLLLVAIPRGSAFLEEKTEARKKLAQLTSLPSRREELELKSDLSHSHDFLLCTALPSVVRRLFQTCS